MMTRTLLATAWVALLAVGLQAQSLAGVAKKTEEEKAKTKQERSAEGKKTEKPSTKVYTNKDLGPVSSAPAPTNDASSTPTSEVKGSATDTTSEQYWRERRRAIDARIHDDMAASAAATKLFISLSNPVLMRRDPAAYLAAKNEAKRTEDAVNYDVTHLVPDFYAEGRRAGVPEEWLRPSDR